MVRRVVEAPPPTTPFGAERRQLCQIVPTASVLADVLEDGVTVADDLAYELSAPLRWPLGLHAGSVVTTRPGLRVGQAA